MQLKQYLTEKKLTAVDFAKRANLPYHKVAHIFRGGIPKLATVLKIVEASHGCISPADLLPKK